MSLLSFEVGLPAYYVLALSEASSNLSRYDGVRYGLREDAEDLRVMYNGSRAAGLGPEVKRRILMGTYALSAGYYDAYYERAQRVRGICGDGIGGASACVAAFCVTGKLVQERGLVIFHCKACGTFPDKYIRLVLVLPATAALLVILSRCTF